jgi:hypothetical protein
MHVLTLHLLLRLEALRLALRTRKKKAAGIKRQLSCAMKTSAYYVSAASLLGIESIVRVVTQETKPPARSAAKFALLTSFVYWAEGDAEGNGRGGCGPRPRRLLLGQPNRIFRPGGRIHPRGHGPFRGHLVIVTTAGTETVRVRLVVCGLRRQRRNKISKHRPGDPAPLNHHWPLVQSVA